MLQFQNYTLIFKDCLLISWMQKHKKYLIITIWISTIAFIAAGMVGWGAYSFSSSSNSVAKVGKVAISANDLNLEYSNLIRRYEQNTGVTLDVEQARALGFENFALQMLINKALLENFSLDSGIRISDEEVSREISTINDFKKDGVFDANLYKEILRANRLKPTDFEEKTRRDLLIQKILELFPAIVTPLEREVLTVAMNLQDRLSIQILGANDVRVDISEEKLKKFYEENKENYKSKKSFEVELISHKIDEVEANEADLQKYFDDNLQNYTKDGVRAEFAQVKDKVKSDFVEWKAKRNALESSIALRDSKIKGEVLTISEDSHPMLVNALSTSKSKTRIEPILDNGVYFVAKIIKEMPQAIEDFSKVKAQVRRDYAPQALRDALVAEAKKRQNVFLGSDIGFFGFGSNRLIPSLNALETQQVLKEIFSSANKNGFVLLGNKVLLYSVLEQKMLENNQNLQVYNDFKSRILEQTVFDFLSKQYKVVNNFRQGDTR